MNNFVTSKASDRAALMGLGCARFFDTACSDPISGLCAFAAVSALYKRLFDALETCFHDIAHFRSSEIDSGVSSWRSHFSVSYSSGNREMD